MRAINKTNGPKCEHSRNLRKRSVGRRWKRAKTTRRQKERRESRRARATSRGWPRLSTQLQGCLMKLNPFRMNAGPAGRERGDGSLGGLHWNDNGRTFLIPSPDRARARVLLAESSAEITFTRKISDPGARCSYASSSSKHARLSATIYCALSSLGGNWKLREGSLALGRQNFSSGSGNSLVFGVLCREEYLIENNYCETHQVYRSYS